MIEPEVLAFEAFLDLLNDPEFDAHLLVETEEMYEIPMHDLDWMLL